MSNSSNSRIIVKPLNLEVEGYVSDLKTALLSDMNKFDASLIRKISATEFNRLYGKNEKKLKARALLELIEEIYPEIKFTPSYKEALKV